MKALHRAVLRQKSPIQLGDFAFLEARYEPANLQQGGRVIKPPRYVWLLHPGVCAQGHAEKIEIDSAAQREALLKGLEGNESFELSPLGMFYKKEQGFELLMAATGTHRTGPNYGLPSLNLQPIKVVSATNPLPAIKKAETNPLWWLQVAAVILFIVFLNVVTLTYLSENGGLNFRQMAKASLFDSLREPNSFEFADETMDEEAISASTDSLEMPQLSISQPDKVSSEADTTAHTTAVVVEPVKVVEKVVEQPVKVAVTTPPAKIEEAKPKMVSKELTSKPMVKDNAPARKAVPSATISSANSKALVQVVVGAFGSSSNADAMVKALKIKGYSAAVLSSKGGKWHRVVLQPTDANVGAEAFLDQVKQNIHPQAWILAE